MLVSFKPHTMGKGQPNYDSRPIFCNHFLQGHSPLRVLQCRAYIHYSLSFRTSTSNTVYVLVCHLIIAMIMTSPWHKNYHVEAVWIIILFVCTCQFINRKIVHIINGKLIPLHGSWLAKITRFDIVPAGLVTISVFLQLSCRKSILCSY